MLLFPVEEGAGPRFAATIKCEHVSGNCKLSGLIWLMQWLLYKSMNCKMLGTGQVTRRAMGGYLFFGLHGPRHVEFMRRLEGFWLANKGGDAHTN